MVRSAGIRERGALGLLLLIAMNLPGCGGEPLYPIRGKVVLSDGDVETLADHYVEFDSGTEPTLRADALITPDGSFTAQSLHGGRVQTGVPKGRYRARVLLATPDDGPPPKRMPPPVHPRYLAFETSGLSFEIPADGELTVVVSRR